MVKYSGTEIILMRNGINCGFRGLADGLIVDQ